MGAGTPARSELLSIDGDPSYVPSKFAASRACVGILPDLVTVTKLLPGQCYQFTDCNPFIFSRI